MPFNILIVNFHSSQNAGDLALLQMTLQQLKEHFPDARFLISANFPEEAAIKREGDWIVPSPWRLAGGGSVRKPRWLLLNLAWGWLLAISKIYTWSGLRDRGWEELFNAYQVSDLVIAIPGNQFFSSGRHGWPLLAVAMAIDLASLFKKPLYIMPQSVGPFRYWWEYKLLQRSYSRARTVFLRDLQSIQIAKKAGLLMSKVKFAPDPAFDVRPADHSDALDTLKKYGYQEDMPSIGVTVIASMPSYLEQSLMDSYYRSVAQSLSAMIQKFGCHVFFFYQVIGPSANEDDRIATATVCKQMSICQDKVHVVAEVLDPARLKACYGCMRMFLASRLHSGIFSMGMGVPTVFIGYLTKTLGVLEALNLQENVIELKDLNKGSLFPLLNQTWLEKETQRQKLLGKMVEIKEQIRAVATSVANDFGR